MKFAHLESCRSTLISSRPTHGAHERPLFTRIDAARRWPNDRLLSGAVSGPESRHGLLRVVSCRPIKPLTATASWRRRSRSTRPRAASWRRPATSVGRSSGLPGRRAVCGDEVHAIRWQSTVKLSRWASRASREGHALPDAPSAAARGGAPRPNGNGYLNGFAVANHSPMPVAMMNAPSSTSAIVRRSFIER